MEVEFQGHYDQAVILKAVALANKPSKQSNTIRIGFALSIGAAYLFYLLFIARSTLSPFDLLTLAILVYILFQPSISSRLIAARLWKNPTIQNPRSGVISETGIIYRSSTQDRKEAGWETFVKKQMSEDLIVLVSANGILSIFPRAFFKSDADWELVRLWVGTKVAEAKPGNPPPVQETKTDPS